MARSDGPRLEIVVLVNERAEVLKEELDDRDDQRVTQLPTGADGVTGARIRRAR